jgi:hypothetical protein
MIARAEKIWLIVQSGSQYMSNELVELKAQVKDLEVVRKRVCGQSSSCWDLNRFACVIKKLKSLAVPRANLQLFSL